MLRTSQLFIFLVTRALHSFFFFFFNDTATTEIYTLSLHDALPISPGKLPHGYPQRCGVLRHRVGDLPRAFVEAQLPSRSAHSPAHCRISPLPSSARSPEYRSYFPATYRSATGTPARPRR